MENELVLLDDVAFERELEGLDDAPTATGFEDADIGVAAHFFLTASIVAMLAADALFESSDICCDGTLAVEADAVAVVEAQL